MTTNTTLDIIENLIQSCRNGEEGYRSAAEHTNDSGLRDFFDIQAKERGRFARELQHVAQNLGEPEPSRDPSVASKIHRAWFDLQPSFSEPVAPPASSVLYKWGLENEC